MGDGGSADGDAVLRGRPRVFTCPQCGEREKVRKYCRPCERRLARESYRRRMGPPAPRPSPVPEALRSALEDHARALGIVR